MYAALTKHYEAKTKTQANSPPVDEGDQLWNDGEAPSKPPAARDEVDEFVKQFEPKPKAVYDLFELASGLQNGDIQPAQPSRRNASRKGARVSSLSRDTRTPSSPPRKRGRPAKNGKRRGRMLDSDDEEDEIEYSETSEEEEDLELDSDEEDSDLDVNNVNDEAAAEPQQEARPQRPARTRTRRIVIASSSEEEDEEDTAEASPIGPDGKPPVEVEGEVVREEGENNALLEGDSLMQDNDEIAENHVERPAMKVEFKRKARVRLRDDDDDEIDLVSGDDDGESVASYGKGRGGSDSESEDSESENNTVKMLIAKCESISENLRKVLTSGEGEETGALLTEASAKTMVNNDSLLLKPYQISGVNWLSVLHRQNINAVLADEMGLGKTIQAVAFLRLLYVRDGMQGPHLVVAPASTIENWMRELTTWLPELNCVPYNGSQSERAHLRKQHKRGTLDRPVDVWLTTYTYFERESSKDDRKFLYSIPFKVCIYDEAHAIKNTDSQRYQSLIQLQSKRRILLSGTPVQNKLDELFALLSFCLPTIFDPNKTKLRKKVFGVESDPKRVRHILAPFILRRLKSQVLSQLSPKTEEIVMLKMLPEQEIMYNRALDEFARVKKMQEEQEQQGENAVPPPQQPGRGRRRKFAGTAITTESMFVELRKIANHPLMVKRRFGAEGRDLGTVATELFNAEYFGKKASMKLIEEEIEKYSDWDLNRCCLELPNLQKMILPAEDLFEVSVKTSKLRELLPELISQGHRILLFSQWTKLLDIFEELLSQLSVQYMRLDGSTAVETRQMMVDSFNSGVGSVFLLSTRAGGLGINLTSADVVILHDLDFNPTIDAQAMDRCHRIGQTKKVRVIKLVVQNTVDEAILRAQQRKLGLNKAVLGEEGAHVAVSIVDETDVKVDSGALLPSLKVFSEGGDDDSPEQEVQDDEAENKMVVEAAMRDALAGRVAAQSPTS